MTGTVTGVALAPGVSLNNRLYTKANITKAYERMKTRLADPNGSPVVMRTHHGAGDDSTRIVAKVKSVSLDPDGTMRYAADFADTEHAQTIRALALPGDDGKPTLAHVSIFGWWMAEPTKVTLDDGTTAETSDDLEINAIDFTADPGVLAASASAESAQRYALNESHDAEITVTETTTSTITLPAAAPVSVKYADLGFLGEKRFPIDTPEQIQSAWHTVSMKEARKGYSDAQIKRIRTRIEGEARKAGITTQDSWLVTGGTLDQAKTSEYYGDYMLAALGDDVCVPASFCFNATNGPISVSISSWQLDPADLQMVLGKATAAITLALQDFDPDMDGDLDADDADSEASRPAILPDSDVADQMETATPDSDADASGTEAPAPAAAETSTPKEPVMAEDTTGAPATEVAAPEIDYAKLAEAMLAAQTKATEEAATKEAEETAKAETATATQAQLREVMKETARELLLEGAVGASRKGHGLEEQTHADPTAAELFEKRGELLFAAMRENARQ